MLYTQGYRVAAFHMIHTMQHKKYVKANFYDEQTNKKVPKLPLWLYSAHLKIPL